MQSQGLISVYVFPLLILLALVFYRLAGGRNSYNEVKEGESNGIEEIDKDNYEELAVWKMVLIFIVITALVILGMYIGVFIGELFNSIFFDY